MYPARITRLTGGSDHEPWENGAGQLLRRHGARYTCMKHHLWQVLAALLLPTVLACSPSAAVDHSFLTISVSAHGLRILVSIANRAYAIGSPVSATV